MTASSSRYQVTAIDERLHKLSSATGQTNGPIAFCFGFAFCFLGDHNHGSIFPCLIYCAFSSFRCRSSEVSSLLMVLSHVAFCLSCHKVGIFLVSVDMGCVWFLLLLLLVCWGFFLFVCLFVCFCFVFLVSME